MRRIMAQTMMVKRTLLLLSVMAAALVAASGMALAVNKACPSGSTEQNPCLGTDDSTRIVKKKKKKIRVLVPGNDTLIGTSGLDYIKALSGNDNISGGAGDDTTDGGAGNDTYSYKDGWGLDTLIDASGIDALNFSATGVNGTTVRLTPELGENYVNGANGARLDLSSGTVVEMVTGSSGWDVIFTGGANNTLNPGPGAEGAEIYDLGGCTPQSYSTCPVAGIPASSDTYSGFAASGFGDVYIHDNGGTADKLVLPFASTDAYFVASQDDGDPALDGLSIYMSIQDEIWIPGQLEPVGSRKGHIEQIVFTDETMTIGSENPQTQALSAEAQIKKLNDASKLDEAEKQKRKEAAKKGIEKAKKEKAQDNGEAQQQSPSSPSGEEKR